MHKTGSLQAPARITAEMIDSYFRFNSGTKAFVQIAAQRVTITTDAIALKKEFLPAKKTITLDNKWAEYIYDKITKSYVLSFMSYKSRSSLFHNIIAKIF